MSTVILILHLKSKNNQDLLNIFSVKTRKPCSSILISAVVQSRQLSLGIQNVVEDVMFSSEWKYSSCCLVTDCGNSWRSGTIVNFCHSINIILTACSSTWVHVGLLACGSNIHILALLGCCHWVGWTLAWSHLVENTGTDPITSQAEVYTVYPQTGHIYRGET